PRTTRSPRGPLVLSVAVAVTGLVGVLDAVLPERPNTLLQALAPERVHPIASALVAPLGLVLVLLARSLARRKRRAHRLAVALLLALSGSPHIGGGFGDWFPISVFIAGLGAVGWLLAGWLAPWRYRLEQQTRQRETARALVAKWGADTLAPFALRADKSYFFSEDE